MQTIMFADISGSTKLFHDIGNENGLAEVKELLSAAQHRIYGTQGNIVKLIGDAILCRFESMQSGVLAANKIHEVRSRNFPDALKWRIGLFHGEVLLVDMLGVNDVYGDAVNIAARIADYASPDTTVTTRDMLALLPEQIRIRARFLGAAQFKGKPRIERMYDLNQKGA